MSVVGLFAFGVTAGLNVGRGMPLPAIHDEFSYLLAADTFARGRITNSPHPLWPHFESMHILVQPTYMSKYPPAQGLTLAAGQVLGGHAAWGLWLATALAAAIAYWMLMAFVPARWALVGGLLVAVHPQLIAWGHSYWGGNVAVLGGALALGGLARLTRRRTATPFAAIWMALGLLLLANSRPYEGLVLSCGLALAVLAGLRWRRLSPALQISLKTLAWPVASVAVPGVLAMCYYNWQVTGSPLRLPYQEHQAQYAVVPLFWFLPMRQPAPTYRHKEFERFYTREQARWYSRGDAWQEFMSFIRASFSQYEGSMALAGITVLMLPSLLRTSRAARLLIFVLGVFIIGLLCETFLFLHYAAPCVGVIAALGTLALRRVNRLLGRIGPLVVGIAIALYLVSSLLWWTGYSRSQQTGFPVYRQRIADDLTAQAGKHLIIVRYGEQHNVHEEWVYNNADIDAAPVVWARDMDSEQNRILINYFNDRQMWLLEPDRNPTQLRPFSP